MERMVVQLSEPKDGKDIVREGDEESSPADTSGGVPPIYTQTQENQCTLNGYLVSQKTTPFHPHRMSKHGPF